MTMAPPADLLSIRDVANRLGVDYQFVKRRTNSGELPSYKLGHIVRISEADLESWMAAHYRNTAPAAQPAPNPARRPRRRPPASSQPT